MDINYACASLVKLIFSHVSVCSKEIKGLLNVVDNITF